MFKCHDNWSVLFLRVCSIFSGVGKFCLALGLRHLTQDIKSDVSCLQISLILCIEKTPKDGVGLHTMLIVKY